MDTYFYWLLARTFTGYWHLLLQAIVTYSYWILEPNSVFYQLCHLSLVVPVLSLAIPGLSPALPGWSLLVPSQSQNVPGNYKKSCKKDKEKN